MKMVVETKNTAHTITKPILKKLNQIKKETGVSRSKQIRDAILEKWERDGVDLDSNESAIIGIKYAKEGDWTKDDL